MTAIPEVLQPFIAAARALWQEPLSEDARWHRLGELLPMLLQSPELQAQARSWPAQAPGPRAQNLLFYEDETRGFVINGLVKEAHSGTPVHDHAHTWTVYGVLQGSERVVRYRRRDDGRDQTKAVLEESAEYTVAPGFVDVVPPGMLHAEYSGAERTVAVILRSERIGGFAQTMVDAQTGAVTRRPGPEQIAYAL